MLLKSTQNIFLAEVQKIYIGSYSNICSSELHMHIQPLSGEMYERVLPYNVISCKQYAEKHTECNEDYKFFTETDKENLFETENPR